MTQMVTIEDGVNIAKGTKVRFLTAPPVLAALIVGKEAEVIGNFPNALIVMLDGKRASVFKGWGTKTNPGRLSVEILEG